MKSDQQIIEKEWVLESMLNMPAPDKAFPRGMPGFQYQAADSNLNGFSGCNQFFGKADFSRNVFTPHPHWAMTKMYCPDTEEEAFLRLFQSANAYTIKKDKLYILRDKELYLVFVPKK